MSVDPISFIAAWGSIENGSSTTSEGFEGPEKRLEIIVNLSPLSDPKGLRASPQSAWEEVVDMLSAKIVSRMSNSEIDAYVLTESSLLISTHKLILITCGTTTLLDSIPSILKIIESYKMEVEWASFMRKNFSYPWEQKGPHASVESEYQTLKSHFPKGKPFIFGPVDADHYFFFAFDNIQRPTTFENDNQMSMTMYQMDANIAPVFYADEFATTDDDTAKRREQCGLSKLFAGWEVQDLQFAPCGYSVNAIQNGEYQTIHVTPEQHCSFVSYETSSPLKNVQLRMNQVLQIFQPKRFAVVLLLDPQSDIGQSFAQGDDVGVEPENFPSYALLNRTVNEFAPGYVMMELNYALPESPARQLTVNAGGT